MCEQNKNGSLFCIMYTDVFYVIKGFYVEKKFHDC